LVSIQIAGLLSDDLLKIAHIHLLICERHAADANGRLDSLGVGGREDGSHSVSNFAQTPISPHV
jgi:hypothetical protein